MIFPLTLFESYYTTIDRGTSALEYVQKYRIAERFMSHAEAVAFFEEMSFGERHRFLARDVYFLDGLGQSLSPRDVFWGLFSVVSPSNDEDKWYRQRPVPGTGRGSSASMYRRARKRGRRVDKARVQYDAKEYGVNLEKRYDRALLCGVWDDFYRGRQPSRNWKRYRRKQYRSHN